MFMNDGNFTRRNCYRSLPTRVRHKIIKMTVNTAREIARRTACWTGPDIRDWVVHISPSCFALSVEGCNSILFNSNANRKRNPLLIPSSNELSANKMFLFILEFVRRANSWKRPTNKRSSLSELSSRVRELRLIELYASLRMLNSRIYCLRATTDPERF